MTVSGRPALTVALTMALAPLAAASVAMAEGGQVVGWGLGSRIGTPSLLRYTQVRAGQNATMALRADGTVAMWGTWSNSGDISAPSGLSQVAQISMGHQFAAALRSDGSVVTWGPLTEISWLQQPPEAGSGITAVDAGGGWINESLPTGHVLALRADTTVLAWGAMWGGQISVPAGLAGVAEIAAGGAHSMARRSDGVVVAWGGRNGFNLGQGVVPTWVGTSVHIAAGMAHSLALTVDGTVQAWGLNAMGQCSVPDNLHGVTRLAAGWYHSIALRSDGSVVAWGAAAEGYDLGQVAVPAGLNAVTSVDAGGCHTVALKADGTIAAWGADWAGQSSPPTGLRNVVQIVGGPIDTLGRLDDGSVVRFGSSARGLLEVPEVTQATDIAADLEHYAAVRPDGTIAEWFGPNMIPPPTGPGHLTGVSKVAVGRSHGLALHTDGTLSAWGVGDAAWILSPISPEAIQIAAKSDANVAVCSDGILYAWGRMLGWSAPPLPSLGSSFIAGAVGGSHALGLRLDGTVVAWGKNDFRQLEVPGDLDAVVQVAAGGYHSLALRKDGSVVAWGASAPPGKWSPDEGQCDIPPGLGRVTQVAAGDSHSVALLSPEPSSCGNTLGEGTATVAESGAPWEFVETWEWSGGGPQVPGALTDVTLGEYGSVGSLCDAQCATLDVPPGSTLLVPVDLTLPPAMQDRSIDVGGLARLRGRVWLLASGAAQLPADFSVPVVNAGAFDGTFSIIQSTLPPPPGKFTTLVPAASLTGGTTWSLALRDLPSSANAGSGTTAEAGGAAIAAEAIDFDGDGFDDLALAIDNGPSQPGVLQVLMNDGTGNLDPLVSYLVPTAPQPRSLATGLVDGDAREDAVVGTKAGNAARLYSNDLGGELPFEPSTNFDVGGEPLSMAVLPDRRVAVGSAAGEVAVFAPGAPSAAQRVGTPGMVPASMSRRGGTIVSGGANPTSIDGLAGTGDRPGRLAVLVPDASGTYALSLPLTEVPGVPVNIDVADIDRDGIDDAITANADPRQPASGTSLAVLTLFRGTAEGFGQPVPIAPEGATAGRDVAMVDVNADGVRDLVSVHRVLVGQTAATATLVNQGAPGGPLTLGATLPIPGATNPLLCPRGDLLGPQVEGVFVVDAGGGTSLTGGAPPALPRAIPFRPEVPTVPPCVGDLNGDASVDGQDLGLLLAAWGPAPSSADLNADGAVDGQDLGVLLAKWGQCPNDR
jgi:alpha-tubulin suppressor-like RCC1 family protein